MMEEINAQMSVLPYWVQRWMDFMGFIFLCSVFFIFQHKAARYTLGIMVLTIVTVLGIFAVRPNVHLFGIAHLVWWTPLLIYLVKIEIPAQQARIKSVYGGWLILLAATILISLFFDVRDLVLVALGQK